MTQVDRDKEAGLVAALNAVEDKIVDVLGLNGKVNEAIESLIVAASKHAVEGRIQSARESLELQHLFSETSAQLHSAIKGMRESATKLKETIATLETEEDDSNGSQEQSAVH